MISPKTFDPIHWQKMRQILLAYKIRDKTVNAIMMLYLDTRSIEKPDGYTDFFKSLAVFFKAILLILTFSPYAFIRPKQIASFHLSHKWCRNHWCRWSGCSIRPSHRCHNTIVLPGRNCQWSWAEHQSQKS